MENKSKDKSNNKTQNRPNNRPRQSDQKNTQNGSGLRKSSRGAAIRAQKRVNEDANRVINSVLSSPKPVEKSRANKIDDTPRLKVIGLGGMDGGGSKNMMLVEYGDNAIIVDCGNDLGVDLPGINYGICDTEYLEQIRHKCC